MIQDSDSNQDEIAKLPARDRARQSAQLLKQAFIRGENWVGDMETQWSRGRYGKGLTPDDRPGMPWHVAIAAGYGMCGIDLSDPSVSPLQQYVEYLTPDADFVEIVGWGDERRTWFAHVVCADEGSDVVTESVMIPCYLSQFEGLHASDTLGPALTDRESGDFGLTMGLVAAGGAEAGS